VWKGAGKMKFLGKLTGAHGPLLRAVGVLSAVIILVTGVTFATLQSQQVTLTGNTISSASADLRIGTTSTTSTAFGDTHAGFSFKDIIPGGPAMPADGFTFYLKNTGSTPLALKLAIGSTPANVSNVDLNKVSIQLTRVENGVGGAPQVVTLQALIDPATKLTLSDPLTNGTVATYKLRVSMASDAFDGSNATIGGIDLVFSGTAVTN
jgi:hypothetical protein